MQSINLPLGCVTNAIYRPLFDGTSMQQCWQPGHVPLEPVVRPSDRPPLCSWRTSPKPPSVVHSFDQNWSLWQFFNPNRTFKRTRHWHTWFVRFNLTQPYLELPGPVVDGWGLAGVVHPEHVRWRSGCGFPVTLGFDSYKVHEGDASELEPSALVIDELKSKTKAWVRLVGFVLKAIVVWHWLGNYVEIGLGRRMVEFGIDRRKTIGYCN